MRHAFMRRARGDQYQARRLHRPAGDVGPFGPLVSWGSAEGARGEKRNRCVDALMFLLSAARSRVRTLKSVDQQFEMLALLRTLLHLAGPRSATKVRHGAGYQPLKLVWLSQRSVGTRAGRASFSGWKCSRA